MKTIVSKDRFDGFQPKATGATCLVAVGNRLLFLRKMCRWPGQWRSPGGTVKGQELPQEAAVRELLEETGISSSKQDLFDERRFFVRSSWGDYHLYVYRLTLQEYPTVTLNAEHDGFEWLSLEEDLQRDLMPGQRGIFFESPSITAVQEKTRLYLVRHGETEWNVSGRWQGWLGSPLTEKGKDQAKRLRDRIDHLTFDACYSSSSERAMQTAAILFENAKEII